ncbi:hypothetical protein SAMN04488085_11626 [Geodermatophilus ruber]|uniref:Uncharacterized protein n=1 Tax=Geodermatophilus ruber TaxID=504800 RepID=A0A1I4JZJ0_9ACTN|nr:hypothetical protein SAMN04488085_11626 [Geodermatophilus ruber]
MSRRTVDSRGVRRRLWTGRGSLKPADVAVELCLRDPATAADVYGTQIPALHQRVHRCAADPEDLRRFLWREEKPTGGHDVPKRLRITHVGLSRFGRGLLREASLRQWGSGLPPTSSSSPARRTWPCAGDWRLERRAAAGWRSSGASDSAHIGGAGEVGPSPVGLQYGLQCPRKGRQVAVVDPPVVQLAGELAEQTWPVAAGGHERNLDLDAPLDDLHRGQTGGSGPRLLPGAVPAGSRAPLRNRPPAPRGDRPTAPAAGRRCCPAVSLFHAGAGLG